MLDALQASWLARAVNESQLATASLSALHLIGFTLIMGGVVLCSLHLLGVLLSEQPTAAITRSATRAMIAGLCLSAVTGGLLVLPRVHGATMNPFFRVKMLLIAIGVLLQVLVVAPLAARAHARIWTLRLSGLASLVVWAGVALAACAFILLE